MRVFSSIYLLKKELERISNDKLMAEIVWIEKSSIVSTCNFIKRFYFFNLDEHIETYDGEKIALKNILTIDEKFPSNFC
jgi:hypothetical protein